MTRIKDPLGEIEASQDVLGAETVPHMQRNKPRPQPKIQKMKRLRLRHNEMDQRVPRLLLILQDFRMFFMIAASLHVMVDLIDLKNQVIEVFFGTLQGFSLKANHIGASLFPHSATALRERLRPQDFSSNKATPGTEMNWSKETSGGFQKSARGSQT